MIATCRDPDAGMANFLNKVPDQQLHKRVQYHHLDLNQENSIEQVSNSLASHGKKPLRLLVNVAGYLNPEKSLRQIDQSEILKHLHVNTIGPLLVSKHFAQWFCAPSQALTLAPSSIPLPSTSEKSTLMTQDSVNTNALLVNISARTGSIADNKLGGWYSYRLSKSALNQITKTTAIELGRRGVVVASLHPGTVVC